MNKCTTPSGQSQRSMHYCNYTAAMQFLSATDDAERAYRITKRLRMIRPQQLRRTCGVGRGQRVGGGEHSRLILGTNAKGLALLGTTDAGASTDEGS